MKFFRARSVSGGDASRTRAGCSFTDEREPVITDTQRELRDRPLQVDRRTAIVGLAGVGALGAVAAACSSGSGDDSADSGSSGAKSGTVLATLADIPVGEAVRGKDGDTAVLVAQPEKGQA